MVQETKVRSLTKAVIWRIGATLGTWCILFVFTHEPLVATRITLAAIVLGTLMYYLYERLWNMISWGKVSS